VVESESRLVEAVLKGQVGKTASFFAYDRSGTTPLNYVLDIVQPEVGSEFTVYWVQNGLPEIFILSGFSSAPISYNTRYVEMSYLLRRHFLDDALNSFRAEIAERTCLRLMAELSVRHGSPDWGVRAFLKAVLGQGIFIADIPGAALMDLEVQPIEEPYMATWFFGLLHELGHLWQRHEGRVDRLFPIEDVTAATTVALDQFPYPDEFKRDGLARALAGDATFTLASEAAADLFAIISLLRTTFSIMQKLEAEFQIEAFVREVVLNINITALLNTCKRAAMIAGESSRERRSDEVLFQPVSYYVRALLTRRYLEDAVARFAFQTHDPDQTQLNAVSNLIDEINRSLETAIDEFETGLARALRFALFPEERGQNLMSQLASEIASNEHSPAISEALGFCDLIDSFHGLNDSASALRRIATYSNRK